MSINSALGDVCDVWILCDGGCGSRHNGQVDNITFASQLLAVNLLLGYLLKREVPSAKGKDAERFNLSSFASADRYFLGPGMITDNFLTNDVP